MKKILTILIATLFVSASAYAEIRIGISGAFTGLSTEGTERTKSSDEKNTGTKDEDVVVPSIFIEHSNGGIAVGLDIVPGEAELGSGTGANDDDETDGANKAGAELASHMTAYFLVPVADNGLYFKLGVARATVETTEVLATGSTYGNQDVDGVMIGAGVNRDMSNGMFVRAEATYTDYESIELVGSADSDSVSNKIDAEVDATAFRISIGKAF